MTVHLILDPGKEDMLPLIVSSPLSTAGEKEELMTFPESRLKLHRCVDFAIVAYDRADRLNLTSSKEM